MEGVGNLDAQASLNMGGKTCNIAIQLNLQHFCKTSCTFFVACFTVHVALVMQFYALSQRESELDRISLFMLTCKASNLSVRMELPSFSLYHCSQCELYPQ